MRPSLATDRISLGLWLDTRFIVNHQGGGEGGWGVCFNNPVNIWDRVCAVLHSRWASHQICDPSRMIATWCSHCSVNPLHPQNYICIQFDVSCLYKLNCNLFNHHERLDFFSASATSIPPSLHVVDYDGWWSGDCAMTWAFHVLQKICRIKIS